MGNYQVILESEDVGCHKWKYTVLHIRNNNPDNNVTVAEDECDTLLEAAAEAHRELKIYRSTK